MLNFIIPFIILIVVVVFIHEYGHYYFAKKYGVGVTDFSLVLAKKFLVEWQIWYKMENLLDTTWWLCKIFGAETFFLKAIKKN